MAKLIESSSETAANLVDIAISTSSSGEAGTKEFRINFEMCNKAISPWHDIPLRSGEYFNMITEVSKHSREKFEINTKESMNPIAQDIKRGKLRDYFGPIFWNYGCLPQTWEDPNIEHPVAKCKGDNDPLDVVEIGSKILPCGSVTKVKVLGALAMIDDGELDWKLIAINVNDDLADDINDISDVDTKMPGVVSGIREWFRWYKTPDDKPLNEFGFDEKALDRQHAMEVIEETHGYWRDLVDGKTERGELWLS